MRTPYKVWGRALSDSVKIPMKNECIWDVKKNIYHGVVRDSKRADMTQGSGLCVMTSSRIGPALSQARECNYIWPCHWINYVYRSIVWKSFFIMLQILIQTKNEASPIFHTLNRPGSMSMVVVVYRTRKKKKKFFFFSAFGTMECEWVRYNGLAD